MKHLHKIVFGVGVLLALVILLVSFDQTSAHRSGCHRWHSCESDSGSYICGDLGYCSACSNNQYCFNGQSRSAAESGTAPTTESIPTQTPVIKPSPNTAPNVTPTAPIPVPDQTKPAPSEDSRLFEVTRVIDGDTIQIRYNGALKKVRLTGIDTPETKHPKKRVQCFGKEASSKMKELVGGKTVRLEKDTIGDEVDKYNRLLRHIYADGVLINAEMIKQGYAYAYTKYPFSRSTEFKRYESEARISQRGLWHPSACPTTKAKR